MREFKPITAVRDLLQRKHPPKEAENVKTNGLSLGEAKQRAAAERGKLVALAEDVLRLMGDREINLDEASGTETGILKAVSSEEIQNFSSDVIVRTGYLKERNGSIFPAVEIRWDREERNFQTSNEFVSRAVRITCNAWDDTYVIQYSSDVEQEMEHGRTRTKTIWKRLDGQQMQLTLENSIYFAMKLADGKMFDNTVQSNGGLVGHGRII